MNFQAFCQACTTAVKTKQKNGVFISILTIKLMVAFILLNKTSIVQCPDC